MKKRNLLSIVLMTILVLSYSMSVNAMGEYNPAPVLIDGAYYTAYAKVETGSNSFSAIATWAKTDGTIHITYQTYAMLADGGYALVLDSYDTTTPTSLQNTLNKTLPFPTTGSGYWLGQVKFTFMATYNKNGNTIITNAYNPVTVDNFGYTY